MAKEGTFQLLGQPNPDVADINKGRIFWDTTSDTFKQIDENGVIKDLTSENPGGNQDNIQFNNLGTLDGSDNFVFDGTAVGIGTATPDTSSLLDLTSTVRGFLMPVMTTVERDAIPSPATGLEIYNITTNEPEFFNGSIWLNTGGTAAGGSNTQVQFNNNGSFDGIAGITTDGTALFVADESNINIGNSSEFKLFRSGINSVIQNSIGDLSILNQATAADIIIQNLNTTSDIVARLGANDFNTRFVVKNLSNQEVFTVDGDGDVEVKDGPLIIDGQLSLAHTGTVSRISSSTGEFTIDQAASADLIIENLSATDDILIRLGNNTNATKFEIQDAVLDDLFTVQGDGKVGIGTSSPLSILQLGNIFADVPVLTFADANFQIGLEGDFGVGLLDNMFFKVFSGPGRGFRFTNNNDDPLLYIEGDTGNVGMGTVTPDTNLHIFSDSAGIVDAATNTILTIENNTDAFISILSPPGDARGILFGDSDSNTDASIVFNDTIANGLNFRTLGFDRMTISNSGSVGINNPNPDTTLHVQSATSGVVQALANTVITAESAGNNFLSLLSPNGLERSIIFGEPSSNNIGSIRYSGPNASQGLDFQVNSLGSVMVIDNTGGVGIGTTSVDASALLDVNSIDIFKILTGTVDTISGNTLISGIGTGFTSELIPGQQIKINSVLFVVDSISSDTIMFVEIAPTFTGFGFDFFSVTKRGFLMPRMTTTERDLIPTPATGLEIFNLTTNEAEFFDGSTWLPLGNKTLAEILVNGNTTGGTDIQVSVNDSLLIGTSALNIFNNATDTTIINDTGGGILKIEQAANADFLLQNSNATKAIIAKLGSNTIATKFSVHDNNDNELFNVLGDGDVGINTSTPDSRLQVVDNSVPALPVLGASWTSQTAASNNAWQGVTFGNGLFVAIAGSGTGDRVMTSPDGVTWTSRLSAEDNNWRTIVFANGLFVALSNDGVNRVMTSPDGITWKAGLAATQSSWKSVTFGNGLFVAVAPGTAIMTSPDGLTWTARTGASGGTWNEVTFGNNTYVAVGDSSITQTSPDGINWTSQTPVGGSWKRVAFGNDLFVAILAGGTAAMFSSDNGVNWTSSGGPNGSWRGLTFGAGFFHACANATGQTMTSTDGDNWTVLISPASNWEYVGYGNGLFVAVAASGNPVMTRTVTATEPSTILKLDSTTRGFLPPRMTTAERAAIDIPDTGLEIFNTTTNNPEFFDGGDWITMRETPGGDQNNVQFKFGNRFDGSNDFVFDGKNVGIGIATPDTKLTVVEGPATGLGTFITQVSAADLAWEDIAFGNDTFVAVATDGTDRVMRSTDNGITWTIISTPLDATGITGIAFGGGSFVATSFGSNSMESTDDGVTWTSRAMTKSDEWTTIAYSETLDRFVAVTAAGAEPKNSFSDDGGLTWTNGQTSGGGGLINNLWNDVTWGDINGGTFVAVSNDGGNRAAFSTDGDIWTQSTTAPSGTLQSVTFGNGIFVGVDNDAVAFGAINSSIDGGVTWVDQAAPNTNQWESVTFGNNLFIAVGDTGTGDRAISSPDGIFWTSETTPVDNAWTGVAFGNDRFVAVSASGTGDRVMTMPLIGTTAAILDLQSTTSGFLPPRMPTVERDLIPSPVGGLELFNNSTNRPNYHDDTDWQTVSTVGTTTIEVFGADDVDRLATNGIITVATGENLTLDIKGDVITSDVRFAMEGSSELRIISLNADAEIIYSGSGTYISGNAARVSINNIVLISTSTGTFLNLTGSSVSILECAIISFDNLGTTNGGGVFLRFSDFIDCDSGFTSTNSNIRLTNMRLELENLIGNFMNIGSPNTDPNTVVVTNVTADAFGASNALLSIDPAINSLTSINITGSIIINGSLFDISGTTGTFTAVADAAVTAESITSVTDSSGIARFNFSAPPTLFVNQEVVISAFVTNTAYNGTFMITATGANFFEVASIAFGSDETGSFLSNSVTLTDTATTLIDGDTLVIDTDSATDYDDGATVYNQLTNSFQINRIFTITQTGSWNTAGIDQEDPRVLAINNPGFVDSKYIVTAFVNNNATANGAIVNNTFTDMVFGTGGSALIVGSTIERWKLIDELNGTFEYTGNEPFDGLITFDFTVTSTGGTVDFRFKWEIDTGSGFGDLPDNVESLVAVSSSAESITKTFPLAAVKGDQIKPQITRNSGTSSITTSFATIYATQ